MLSGYGYERRTVEPKFLGASGMLSGFGYTMHIVEPKFRDISDMLSGYGYEGRIIVEPTKVSGFITTTKFID